MITRHSTRGSWRPSGTGRGEEGRGGEGRRGEKRGGEGRGEEERGERGGEGRSDR